jgi:hypothetical protein
MLKKSIALLPSPHKSKLPSLLLLVHKQKYTYISPVDKPILSLTLKSLHELSAEFMSFGFVESAGSICPELSVLLGGFAFKICIEVFCGLIRVTPPLPSNYTSKTSTVSKNATTSPKGTKPTTGSSCGGSTKCSSSMQSGICSSM